MRVAKNQLFRKQKIIINFTNSNSHSVKIGNGGGVNKSTLAVAAFLFLVVSVPSNLVGHQHSPTSNWDHPVHAPTVFLLNGHFLTNGCFMLNASSDARSHAVVNRRSTARHSTDQSHFAMPVPI